MTVERVRITPNQITLKNANNKVVFDTNNQYIRTEATGNLKLNVQMPAVRFTTVNQQVLTSNTQGAIIGYVPMSTIVSTGQTFNYRFPEFTGTLVIAVSNYNESAGGQPVFIGLYRLRVAINGVLTVAAEGTFPGSRHILFNPQGGGGASVVPIGTSHEWRWNNVQPGSLITLGSIYRTDQTGVTIMTDPVTANPPGAPAMMYTLIAIQNDISTLPLTVTP